MTPDTLWKRYAAIWSLPADERPRELEICLAGDATYCDPNGLIEGRQSLSDYMGAFQGSVPGGRFHIKSVQHHHDRSLAHWDLQGPDAQVLQSGTSFALAAEDGRLRSVSGFFSARDEG